MMPTPPFQGNAWEFLTVADGEDVPADCEPLCVTAGGTLVRRRWGPIVPYDPPAMPYWRLEYRMIDGAIVRTYTETRIVSHTM